MKVSTRGSVVQCGLDYRGIAAQARHGCREPLPCLCTRQAGVKRPNSRNMRFWSTLVRRATPRGVVMGVVMSDADLGVRWRRSARSCSRRVGSGLAVAINPSVSVVAYARACTHRMVVSRYISEALTATTSQEQALS